MDVYERCPYCDTALYNDIYDYWWHHESPTSFDFKCPECKKVFSVEVEAIPDFLCYSKDVPQSTEEESGNE